MRVIALNPCAPPRNFPLTSIPLLLVELVPQLRQHAQPIIQNFRLSTFQGNDLFYNLAFGSSSSFLDKSIEKIRDNSATAHSKQEEVHGKDGLLRSLLRLRRGSKSPWFSSPHVAFSTLLCRRAKENFQQALPSP